MASILQKEGREKKMIEFKQPFYAISPDCPYHCDISDCHKRRDVQYPDCCSGCEYLIFIKTEEELLKFQEYEDMRLEDEEE